MDPTTSDAAHSSSSSVPELVNCMNAASPELMGLPVELVHNISQFLAPSDVSRLSKTCFRLETVLNDDDVWGRYLSDESNCLDTVEQQVEPAVNFINFKICPNRIKFLKREHLLNNWENGNCKEESSTTTHTSQCWKFHSLKGSGQCFYKERYVFIGRYVNEVQSDRIDVWDVHKKPVLHTYLEIENLNYEGFHIIGDHLVVAECLKVCVYRIQLLEIPSFLLEYSFIADEDSVCYNGHVDHVESNLCLGLKYSSAQVYLLMNRCREPSCVLHVWNIPEGRKEGAFESPFNGIALDLYAELNDNYLVIHQNTENGWDGMFYIFFDIKKKRFSSYVCKFSTHALGHRFFDDRLLVLKSSGTGFDDTECCVFATDVTSDVGCTIHDLDDESSVVVKRTFNTGRSFWIPSTEVIDGKFAISCVDFVYLVKASTLETINKFVYDPSYKFIYHLNIMNSIFVLARDLKDKSKVNLLDVENQKVSKIFGIGVEHIFINNSRSKLVVISYLSINVIHFW